MADIVSFVGCYVVAKEMTCQCAIATRLIQSQGGRYPRWRFFERESGSVLTLREGTIIATSASRKSDQHCPELHTHELGSGDIKS
jgi:hypothetical protein